MKIIPQFNLVLGRIVDLSKTKGGIHLASTQVKNVTVFVLIDEVGPDVTKFKKGDIVVPHHLEHVYLRGGQHHRVLVEETAIRAVVEDVPVDQFTIEGEEPPTARTTEAVAGAPV